MALQKHLSRSNPSPSFFPHNSINNHALDRNLFTTFVTLFLVFARLPFVAAAFYNGIPSTKLTDSSVSVVIEKVIGFDIPTIIKEMKIKTNSNNFAILSSVNYQQLGARLSQISGKAVSYRQLYHISVYSLLDAVLTRRSTVDTTRAVEQAIRYIALQMTLHEVTLMHAISPPKLMGSSLVDLLAEYSHVTGSEVAVALNISSIKEKLLTRVRIVDAQILLGIGREIFGLTTERIGHRVITLHQETVVLFTTIEELLQAKSLQLAELNNLKLPYFLASAPQINIDQVLRRMNISKDSQTFIYSKPLAQIALARSTQLLAFAKWHIFKVFWEFKAMISRGKPQDSHILNFHRHGI